jgi:hypothetical protein
MHDIPHNLPGELIRIATDDPEADFQTAKDLAKRTARERWTYPMILSWFDGTTGQGYPAFECGSHEKPPWILYAESRGADLSVVVNDGRYIFLFLTQ